MGDTLRIGTRKSPLALWQAHYVKQRLQQTTPGLEVQLVEIVTSGDRHLATALAKIGGKGLFLKELEQALLAGSIDIAVHSMKDVTAELPSGLHIPVVCQREDPSDALVANHYSSLAQLPKDAKVGTCSLRRKSQLAARFAQLQLVDLRGNINTRLQRLDDGDFAAIILASAGLMRLGLAPRITQRMGLDEMLPAVGQGALGIECCLSDAKINALLAPLNCPATKACITAERAANKILGGGCHVPVAAFAQLAGTTLSLRALVGSVDGQTILSCEHHGDWQAAAQIGALAARDLIAQGADNILATVYRELGGEP